MPLRVIQPPLQPAQVQNALKESFLIFYSTIVDGRMWCPDCLAVEDLINTTFEKSSHSASIIFVGTRAEWKRPAGAVNPFRHQPWNVESVPTIIKLVEGKEVARLVDDEITPSKLAAFV